MFEEFLKEPEYANYSLFAKNIIKAKSKKIFAKDNGLNCLIRSEDFFQDVLNIFNYLFYSNIKADSFKKIVNNFPNIGVDKKRLELVSDLYTEYLAVMNKNGWKIPYPPVKNRERLSVDDLSKLLPKKKTCLQFADIQSEAVYIAQKIKDIVASTGAHYSDIGIFADKFETRQKFLDVLKAEQIPVASSIYNEDYENLKYKIGIYQKISEVCLQLCMDSFSSDAFKNLHSTANFNSLSKSQKEICLEALDEIFKSFLPEVLDNSSILDKLLSKQETFLTSISLIELIYKHWSLLNEKDRDVLVSEFSAIKSFYEFFKYGNYAGAISSVRKKHLSSFEKTNLKDVIAGKIKSLNELQNLYDNIICDKSDFSSFYEILKWLPQDKSKDENSLKLASISADLKKQSKLKYVFVVGLTENNFPGNNQSYPFISIQANDLLVQELKKWASDFKSFITTDELYNAEREKDFVSLCSLVSEEIVFSTHSYEVKKSVQPASIFKIVSGYDDVELKFFENNVAISESSALGVENLPDDTTNETVIGQDDVLKLNPSSINSYQSCPRKYFYKNLLNLKEKSNFAASYGSTVHAIFEVLNKKYLMTYTKQKALELAEVLFNSKQDEETSLAVGFGQTDIELVKASDDLSLKEMKENITLALDDFELSGYFAKSPIKAVCEKTFSFSLDELPNVIFDGRIDLICTDEDHNISVIDYKTGKNKTNTLDYAISENGVSFLSKTGKEPANVKTLQNAYDYQIPLYYLATQNSDELSEYRNINALGLLYVRPKNKDNGCNDDFVEASRLEEYKDKIVQNLKETVIDKIKSTVEFEMNKSFNCDLCSYKFLCDEGNEDG